MMPPPLQSHECIMGAWQQARIYNPLQCPMVMSPQFLAGLFSNFWHLFLVSKKKTPRVKKVPLISNNAKKGHKIQSSHGDPFNHGDLWLPSSVSVIKLRSICTDNSPNGQASLGMQKVQDSNPEARAWHSVIDLLISIKQIHYTWHLRSRSSSGRQIPFLEFPQHP